MAQISRKGFGQVEPNHLSGIVEGKIYAQLPVDKTAMGSIIENGRFAKYDYASGKVNLAGKGDWLMIYNEQKLYDERKQSLKDFALIATDFTDSDIYPRLIKIEVGDIFTTNTFGANTSSEATVVGPELKDKAEATAASQANPDQVIIDVTTGYLKKKGESDSSYTGPVFEVVKSANYYMPDMTNRGVKLQRIS